MSKKSDRSAQVRKARLALPSQGENRPEGSSAPAVDRKPPAPPKPRKPRKPLPKWAFWSLVLLGPVVAVSCLCGLVSLLMPAIVPTPPPYMPGLRPSLEVINPSFLPIYRVQYSCAFLSVTDQSGFAVSVAQVAYEPDSRSVLYRGNRTGVECEGRVNLQGLRVKTSDSLVSISYYTWGWPFRRHLEYRVEGEFDPLGNPRRWSVL